MASWYAMKVFFNKVFEIEHYFQDNAIECYVPVQYEEKVVKGEQIRVRKPSVSSLIFLRTEEDKVQSIENNLAQRVILYRYRQSRQPAKIPDREMEVFQMVTSVDGSNWDYVDAESMQFAANERVRVVDGPFKGAEGYIKRIKGNRRLVVAIEGIVAVATTYIPSCFLEKLSQP